MVRSFGLECNLQKGPRKFKEYQTCPIKEKHESFSSKLLFCIRVHIQASGELDSCYSGLEEARELVFRFRPKREGSRARALVTKGRESLREEK